MRWMPSLLVPAMSHPAVCGLKEASDFQANEVTSSLHIAIRDGTSVLLELHTRTEPSLWPVANSCSVLDEFVAELDGGLETCHSRIGLFPCSSRNALSRS